MHTLCIPRWANWYILSDRNLWPCRWAVWLRKCGCGAGAVRVRTKSVVHMSGDAWLPLFTTLTESNSETNSGVTYCQSNRVNRCSSGTVQLRCWDAHLWDNRHLNSMGQRSVWVMQIRCLTSNGTFRSTNVYAWKGDRYVSNETGVESTSAVMQKQISSALL